MFCAWRYGREDPWRLYNRLGVDYRPLWDPSLPPKLPRHPSRYRAFMYACGKAAAILDRKMKDTRPAVAQAKRRKSRVELPAGVEDPRER